MTKIGRRYPWLLGAVLGVLTLSSWGLAVQVAPFSATLEAKSRCRVAIEILHPAQFAVGYDEVELRAASIAKKSPADLKAYLDEHRAKIVIGPEGTPYLIDGHHLALAMGKARKADTLEVEVVANWRDMSEADFWKNMKQRGWVYLYDQNGRGPLESEALPKKVTEMADDPYRSLAWLARKRGGYEKTEEPFAEFQWANYFRSRVSLTNGNSDIKRAVKAALKISHSPEAKNLPGYKP